MVRDRFPWTKNRNWAAARRDTSYYKKYGFNYEVKRMAANVIKQAYDNYNARRLRRNPLFEYSREDFIKYGIEERINN